MVIFTNIGIGTEQQEDRYRYRYLYSSNISLYINGLCIGFLRYPYGYFVPKLPVLCASYIIRNCVDLLQVQEKLGFDRNQVVKQGR